MLSFGRFHMDVLLQNLATTVGLGEDPRVVYSLAAAALLALVSLLSGLGRLDVAALFRPANLLLVGLGVLLAFGLVVLTERWPVLATGESGLTASLGFGLARVPLYLLALAFGPSVGLVAGVLFSAATAIGPYPGWSEAILVLELVILGWLAISPSPRRSRWAGPAGAAGAYVLALGTAGVAFEVWRTGELNLAALLAAQGRALPGLVAAWLALAAFGPELYERYMPGSRIRPLADRGRRHGHQPEADQGTPAPAARAARTTTPTLEVPALERRERPQGRRLVEHVWHNEDPNG